MGSGENGEERVPPQVEREEEENDAEELRAVGDLVKSVGELLQQIVGFVKQIMDEILDSLKGDKLGSEVAAFYKQLRDAGMPDEMVAEMTRQYFERRIAIADLVKMLPQLIQNELGSPGVKGKPKVITVHKPDQDIRIEFSGEGEEGEEEGEAGES